LTASLKSAIAVGQALPANNKLLQKLLVALGHESTWRLITKLLANLGSLAIRIN
jgi:hypothetical protein